MIDSVQPLTNDETGKQGDLPEGWVWTTLENCVDILDHRRVPINANEREARISGKSASEIYPYYGATGQVGWIDSYLFDEEIILLGEDGAPFLEPNKSKAYLVRGKSWVNNHAHVLTAVQELTTNSFIQHYLNIFDFHGYVTGTTRLKLNQAQMRRIPVPLPPLAEQRRIVAAIEEQFTRLDAGVAALKRTQASLKRYRAAVLKAACEGKLVPQDPSDEPASVLLARILAERRTKWEAEQRAKGKDPSKVKYPEPAQPNVKELPELPDGWCWATVDQMISMLQYGTSVKADASSDNGIPVLRMGNIQEGKLDLSDMKYIDPQKEDIAKYELCPGDVLINRTNSPELVGKAGLFLRSGSYVFASYLIRLRTEQAAMLPQYLNVCLNSEVGRRHVVKVKHQVAGQANINSQDIRTMPIPLPPLAEQERIVAEVERRLSVVEELEVVIAANLKRGERLRQAILKRAFEGKLVPQDPSDEPASVLLERIRAERETRDGRGKRKMRQLQLPVEI